MTSAAPAAREHDRSPHSRGRVHRIEVFPAPGCDDPIGDGVARDARAMGIQLSGVRASRVYLLEGDLDRSQLELIRSALLADPVVERAAPGTRPIGTNDRVIEVHPLPGVMDPAAMSVRAAICELLEISEAQAPDVATGWRYDISGATHEQVRALGTRLLANPVIQRVVYEPFVPAAFPVGTPHDQVKRFIPIRELNDDALNRLSRDAHLFLSLDEMQAIQSFYRSAGEGGKGGKGGRDPADIELETLAQTWSEHCVHKTLKSTVRYRRDEGSKAQGHDGKNGDPIDWSNRPGHEIQPDGTIVIHNLLKSTVAAATHRLIKEGVDWTLSVFVDNSGVIAFDDQTAVCIKVETHNHPSAIEPYGGAATGVGGCIRDVVATGLGSRPIANTDVFCVAHPDAWRERGEGELNVHATGEVLPPGTLHPRRILQQVVAGVRDYGNRMGIPTVSGAVAFDNRYVGNPLVFCGCIGVMPRSRVRGDVQRGDLIVAIGGRTGRDGLHGATFSSAELEHTAADEFAHAVQIGNAITQKRAMDAILRAAEVQPGPLFSGMTDCGAGGFSSAIGELGKSTGAIVHLERAPLKYAGLSFTEIWISEAQERFVLAVPEANLDALRKLCDEEGAELCVLGTFTNPPGSTPENPDLQLLFKGQEVGRLSMHFLHEGIPTPHREAVWKEGGGEGGATKRRRDEATNGMRRQSASSPSIATALPALLAHPNIASKHWIIRQYDHEVRGNTLLRPLVGPLGRGPGDASIIQPVPGSPRALAVSCGLQTGIGDPDMRGGYGDPYLMTIAAIDECVRNLVCVGADPSRIAILDNFCWPSCKKPENLGSLVRAAEGCYDGAIAYRTPFVSGKDSLNNQLTVTNPDGTTRTIEIPPTLLITGMAIVSDVTKIVSMDAKRTGRVLVLVSGDSSRGVAMGGSVYSQMFGLPASGLSEVDASAIARVPRVDLKAGPAAARAIHDLISAGLVHSAHDVSEGGLLVAAAEMLIAGSSPQSPIGARLTLQGDLPDVAELFGESPSTYLLEVDPGDSALDQVAGLLGQHSHNLDQPLRWQVLGELDGTGRLELSSSSGIQAAWEVEDLAQAWLRPLDW